MSKTIIITGTSRGIGLELAKQFTDDGHTILALSRNTRPVEALKRANITTLACDITKASDLKKVEAYAKEHWKAVDILIHNAGNLIHDDFEQIDLSSLERVYQTNVFGVFGLTQRLLSSMHAKSHVMAISSMGGIQGSVKFPGLTAYSSSKAAVINLMEVLAEEYKTSGPVFNALALGAVNTEMFKEAFPGGEASIEPEVMADYIKQFALTGHKVYNGKVLQVSNSTP